MKKIRVYELAKDLNIESKVLVDFLLDLGADVKNHMSTIENDIAQMVYDHFKDDSSSLDVDIDVDEEEDTFVKKPRKGKRSKSGKDEEIDDSSKLSHVKTKRKKYGKREAQVKEKELELPDTIVVKDLAAKLGTTPSEIIKKLIKLGVMVTLNQTIDYETASVVCSEFGVESKPYKTLDETIFEEQPDDEKDLQHRPPVVTIMGHVDHGKTTLLDSIRATRVTATEAGGITQHIGAYQVDYNGKKITFIDTPGHEAFTAMRSRGAQVTDIAILVVAADDGIMPQTVEAINHAKAAKVPIIVAINKIDKPTADPDRVKQGLTEHGLLPEEWGGDTICVPLSALKGEGIDELLEMILLVAEMEDFKANPDRQARGTVIEAKLDKGRGPVATVLISNGTLRVGDIFAVGNVSGRVRALIDDQGRQIKEAGPSKPVEILGISDVPEAGDVLVVVDDEQTARQVASLKQHKQREKTIRQSSRVTLDDLFAKIKEGEVKELNVVLKADVQGSAEAVRQSLEKLSTDEVRVVVIHQGVGGITESDVNLAATANAIIVGFNVRPEPGARIAAEKEEIDIRLYRVIYDLIDEVKAAMVGLLDPEFKEVTLGRAEVRETFKVPNIGMVAGCYILEGKIVRSSQVRVVRDNVVVYESKISSLRRFKDDVREVAQGYECGIGVEGFNDIKLGDILEAYTMEKVERKL